MSTRICRDCGTTVRVSVDGSLPRHLRDGEHCPGGETDQHLGLPWAKPPLSLNDRLHWASRYRKQQEVKATVKLLARNAKLRPVEHAVVTLHYRPRDNRARDKDNLFATIKPCIDGLRDAGIFADDDSAHVTPQVDIHRAQPGMPGCCWLSIKEEP